jgi:hypothetical protein
VFQLGPLDTKIDQLGASCFQLSFGLRHVDTRGNPAVVPIPRELQSFLVGNYRRIQQLSLCVKTPQGEVVYRQVRLSAQA